MYIAPHENIRPLAYVCSLYMYKAHKTILHVGVSDASKVTSKIYMFRKCAS